MRAAILEGFGKELALADVSRPSPEPDQVLIRIEFCGVCHSDLHIIDGDLARFRAATKPRLIPGHEVVGVVAERGADVTELEVGERVGVAWKAGACGTCDACREGLENLCPNGGVTGMTQDGGYAEWMVARADFALPVPGTIAPAEAAPLFCAGVTSYRALSTAGVGPGQRVAIFGVGGLGHLAIQIARALGAEVSAFDINPEKLRLAQALGAAFTFDASTAEAVKAVRRRGGVHVAVVTSPARAAFDAALQCLRPGGTLSVVGLPSEPLSLPALSLVGNETRVMGSAVGTRADIRAVLALAAQGAIRCHTATRPLAEVNQVLAEMRHGKIEGRVVLAVAP